MKSLPVLTCTVAALCLGACATLQPARPAESARHQLTSLEPRFDAFVAHPFVAPEGDSLAAMEHQVEDAKAEMQRLRLTYLGVVQRATRPHDRVVGMLRIAELHLDLGARIRRMPYPSSPHIARADFDAALSRHAVSLEATGFGILQQLVSFAEHRAYEDRFVQRAVLYLQLHREKGEPVVDVSALGVLRHELRSNATFSAPRRLLQRGRLGQRSERISRAQKE